MASLEIFGSRQPSERHCTMRMIALSRILPPNSPSEILLFNLEARFNSSPTESRRLLKLMLRQPSANSFHLLHKQELGFISFIKK